jgi:hypothetical protein
VKKYHKPLLILIQSIFLLMIPPFSSSALQERGTVVSETWMGIYMEGVKVGYSHNLESTYSDKGEKFLKFTGESWMKISRLGGAPVEIASVQESDYREDETPVKTEIRTKMSESEIVLRADVLEDRILFRSGEKLIKEFPFTGKFYLAIPLEEIIKRGDLKPGNRWTFPLLDPLSYAIKDSTFEVIGRERVLILGEEMDLWHVRTEMTSVIPVVMEEWIDDKGEVWKSVSQASFMTTTSIRMAREKALEMSGENLDIAFSTVIPSNVIFENPLQVKEIMFKLSGISPEAVKRVPFDDGSQTLLDSREGFFTVRTNSLVFREEESVRLPVTEPGFQNDLQPTAFCQSDDRKIVKTAEEIVGEEKNAWRAAKKIADWVSRKIKPNYDVGFATASEILKNREGDCSEHTVIMVALCRAAGIPARAAVGVMYAGGIFAYHMWPEVYAGRWINLDAKWLAVDQDTGEYFTDATHIKLGRSSLDENIFQEMAGAVSEMIGKLKIEVLDFHQDE